MSDETQDNSSVPGSGAGDAAPTQEIPRIPKPLKKAPAKKAPAKRSPSAASSNQPSSNQPSSNQPSSNQSSSSRGASNEAPPASLSQTDKGRTRPTPPAAKKPVYPMSSNSSTSTASGATAPVNGAARPATDQLRPGQSDGSEVGRPLTAADYARTTGGSASVTAVIPAVKDSKESRKPSFKPQITVEPAVHPGSGRRASLRLVRVEPWSVTRLAFAISVALMIVGVVAVTIFWVVLDISGVWDQINGSVTSVLSDDSSGFDITDYLGFGRLVGLTLVLSAINVILSTALATIGAHLYNRAAQLLGGVEVTFSEQK